jgi:excisionase family DNA binding protein
MRLNNAEGQSPHTLDAVNTVEEVAEFAKVSPRTVMRAIAAGRLAALRAETQLRVTDQAVWAWLKLGRR